MSLAETLAAVDEEEPHPASSGGMALGFPRTRGDGPGWRYDRRKLEQVSPHPRGWTPDVWGKWGWGIGFPAPAGMDPYQGA